MTTDNPGIQIGTWSRFTGIILVLIVLLLLLPSASADESWILVTDHAGWSARGYFSSVAMPDGSIVLMGGEGNNGNYNDVWRSTDDGATWMEMTANAEWTARASQSSVALPDGSIVLIGGGDSSGDRNDVWRSTDDGATWTQMTANAGWIPRSDLSSVVMPDGSIIVSGGTLPGGYVQFNDVWRSTDKGATWMEMTANGGWYKRYGHRTVAMPDGSIVLTGGYSFGPSFQNDVWRSTDYGVTWTQVSAGAGWSPRYYHSMVAMPDDSIVLEGGNYRNEIFMDDTWQSSDSGKTWTRIATNSGWTGRFAQASVVLPDGSLILMGGNDGKPRNDVWRLNLSPVPETPGSGSRDGISPWQTRVSDSTGIHLVKTISPHAIKLGTTAEVSIYIQNTGITPIHDIEILDDTRPEFPVVYGQTSYSIPQLLQPNETRTLKYTISATKPGTYLFNGTAVMFAGADGNYHRIRFNSPGVVVLAPLIPPAPDKSPDLLRAISEFFRNIFS
jgi:photosystem II stability/assembly factor-like uncharacterized protein